MNNTATLPIRIFGASSYALLSINGLILNSLLIWTLHRSQWTFQKVAFYSITWQLIVCDVGTHSMEFIVPIPLTAAGFDLYGNTLFLYIPCFIDTVVYCGTLLFSFLMTVNRITVFIAPRLNTFLFQEKLYITVGFVWFFDVSFVISLNALACYKSFSSNGFYYHHVCPNWEEEKTPGYYIYMSFFQVSGYLPIIMFVTYVVMIIMIKFKLSYEINKGKIVRRALASRQNSTAKIKKEFSLLAQGFLICGFLEIQKIAFTAFPQIPADGQWVFIINFAGNWISLLLNSIHPIVLFSFNRDIQIRLKGLLMKTFLGQSVVVAPASTSFQHHSSGILRQ